MKAWFIVLVSAILLSVACGMAGCEDPSRAQSDYRMNVERVFQHEPGRYSVLVKIDGELKTYEFPRSEFHLIADVPAGQSKWVSVHHYDKPQWAEDRYAERRIDIHIHDSSEVDGGGWNHGKFGSGQTTVIQ